MPYNQNKMNSHLKSSQNNLTDCDKDIYNLNR